MTLSVVTLSVAALSAFFLGAVFFLAFLVFLAFLAVSGWAAFSGMAEAEGTADAAPAVSAAKAGATKIKAHTNNSNFFMVILPLWLKNKYGLPMRAPPDNNTCINYFTKQA